MHRAIPTGRCNTEVQSQLDSSQIEPELRAVLSVAALQLHVTDHPPSVHGHACASDGSSPSQTEAPIDATRVAMKPVLYSSAHEHACAGGGCSPSQTDAPSNTTVAAMAPDSTQTEPELWSVLPVVARTSTNHIYPFTVTYIHTPWVDLGVM